MPEFVNPKQILEQVGLRSDMTAADFGSGSGGWAIPLAVILKDGAVFAVDVQETALSALQSKAKLYDVSNIRQVLANVEQTVSQIRDNSCDFVLLSDILFQVDNKEQVFQETARVLKNPGKVLVVEWNESSPLGPKQGRVSKQEALELAQKAGLKKEKEFKAGDYHFALLFNR